MKDATITRLLDVLEGVMKYQRTAAGSPQEHRANAAAFAELAQHGRGTDRRHEHELAYAQWEQRVKQRTCKHTTGHDDHRCSECGLRLAP